MKCARKEAGGFHPPLQRRLCGHMKCDRKRRAGFTCPYSDCRGTWNVPEKKRAGFIRPYSDCMGAWNAPEKKLAGFTCPYIGEVGFSTVFFSEGRKQKIGGGGGN